MTTASLPLDSESATAKTLTIRRPDDWHLHLRDGAMLRAVLPYTAAQFTRAIIMPNLAQPVVSVEAAQAYRERILAALPQRSDFTPLMTCYLTDATSPDEIERGFRQQVWVAAKLYPLGATTNSHQGVRDISKLAPVLERMEKIGMPLLVHGEVTDPAVDLFDREAIFMEEEMLPLLKRHQGLKVVVEHMTTAESIDLVRAHAGRAAGTITPLHLLINRTALFQGGLRPHLFCLPIAKSERHRRALREAATSGDGNFFTGTDSAPHLRTAKQGERCAAGVFTAATALQSYVQVFDEEGALDRFEAFASENGPRFYGLPLNQGTVTLHKRPSRVPQVVAVGEDELVVYRGGEELSWMLSG